MHNRIHFALLPYTWFEQAWNRLLFKQTQSDPSAKGEILMKGGFGMVSSIDGKDSVEKTFHSDDNENSDLISEYNNYKTLYKKLGKDFECQKVFLSVDMQGERLVLAPKGIDLENFMQSLNNGGPGEPKYNRCKNNQQEKSPLDLCGLLYILHDILSAVDCMHRNGLAHGDIKPANILIECPIKDDEANVRYTGLLIDFGSMIETSSGWTRDVGGAHTPSFCTFERRQAWRALWNWQKKYQGYSKKKFNISRQEFAQRLFSPKYNACADDWFAVMKTIEKTWNFVSVFVIFGQNRELNEPISKIFRICERIRSNDLISKIFSDIHRIQDIFTVSFENELIQNGICTNAKNNVRIVRPTSRKD